MHNVVHTPVLQTTDEWETTKLVSNNFSHKRAACVATLVCSVHTSVGKLVCRWRAKGRTGVHDGVVVVWACKRADFVGVQPGFGCKI